MQLPAYQKSAIMILVSYHHERSWWSNRIALCAPTQGAIFLFYFEYLSQREVVNGATSGSNSRTALWEVKRERQRSPSAMMLLIIVCFESLLVQTFTPVSFWYSRRIARSSLTVYAFFKRNSGSRLSTTNPFCNKDSSSIVRFTINFSNGLYPWLLQRLTKYFREVLFRDW